MKYKIITQPEKDYRVSRYMNSIFFENLGRGIYDGFWVGKDSDIPNIDGIRLAVIEGCREIGVGAIRWPGGSCADHYHWKDGIGEDRPPRYHAIPTPGAPVMRHEFGTDEFMKLCELTGADPIITVNTATGTCEEFLDWYEYMNGTPDTKYGQMRARNGHPEPYNVYYWAFGNTDDNVWQTDFNRPQGYAHTYRKFQSVIRGDREKLYLIGLGLSERSQLQGWVGKCLDAITQLKKIQGPDALSVHCYVGGAKQGGEKCGDAVDYTDEGYYALLDRLKCYQDDIDIHRVAIKEHTSDKWPTKICFDEWGIWHPEATLSNNINQRQTMRDAICAALILHIFYRNSDIVEFAMETQPCNLLQSLFETDGARFYKTPTFYVMKLFRDHLGQYCIPLLGDEVNQDLDSVATMSEDVTNMTISIVNRNLYDECEIALSLAEEGWQIEKADIVTAEEVRTVNTFDEPERICDAPFAVKNDLSFTVPAHSVVRICLVK